MPINTPWRVWAAGLAAMGLLALGSGPAQAGSRTQLQEEAFPAPVYHTVTVRVVVDVGGEVPPHTHPGIEMGYVIGGMALLNIAGQSPRALAAGDSFAVPPMTVHSVRNTGDAPLVLLSTYVVEAGKPIVMPAP